MAATIGHAVAQGIARLGHLPDVDPRLEAELLLGLAAQLTRAELMAWPERRLSEPVEGNFRVLLERRAGGEPFAYLSGRQAFWSLEVEVTPATLIPRPETELLVELALETLPRDARLRVADLGTGSGVVAAALAGERRQWQLVATDRCPAALAVAGRNFAALGLGNVALVRGDWLAPFAPASCDALIGNPPYVRDDDPHLTRGGLDREPRQALAAGPDGLDAIRAILAGARSVVRPGGLVALEHGYDQGEIVRALFATVGLTRVGTRCDLAGLERVTCGWRPAGDG
ncbi:peptide chain release factor N(5)-glutamine methyltransferase [Thioflavicoccus mobilis]|nr:peptide chain release factor N(5)-glutamine methyltransferase [Thioflavicoccus mobilis]